MSWAFRGVSTSFQSNVDISNIWQYWLMAFGISCIYLVGTFFMSKRVQDMIRVTGELSSV